MKSMRRHPRPVSPRAARALPGPRPLVLTALLAAAMTGWGAAPSVTSGDGLSLTATARALPTHIEITGDLRDDSGGDRAIVLTFALPLDPAGRTWDDDIRSSRSAGAGLFLANTLSHGGGTAGDLHSIYPFSCLRDPDTALCWGIPLDRPVVCRMAYNGAKKRYEIAFDFGLSRATAKFPGRAAFTFILYRSDPAWGFRAAARRFYDIYPTSFMCRPAKQGIWMPFVRISGIEDPEDFGFMFQEGAPEVAFDDKIGVYDFVYVEPWSVRLYLPATTRDIPTPGAVLADPAVVAKQASEIAIARSSAVTDRTGEFQTRSYLTSWAAGSRVYDFMAVPDPEIPGETKAALMDRLIASRFAEEEKKGAVLDGVYFDAFGEWTGQANYRKELWATADFPLGISRATRQPVQIYAFGVYEYVAHMSRTLHPKGKMLMANGYIYGGYPFTAHWLDVGGNEIHWERQGTDPSFFDYRRTLAYRRPCLLLNNENFDVFKCDRVEEYFQKSLLWGFFPSTEDSMAVDLTFRNHAEDVLQGYVKVKAPASWTAAPALHDIVLKPREERVERLVLRGSTGASGIYTIQASMTDLARLPIAETSLDLALVNPENNRLHNAGFLRCRSEADEGAESLHRRLEQGRECLRDAELGLRGLCRCALPGRDLALRTGHPVLDGHARLGAEVPPGPLRQAGRPRELLRPLPQPHRQSLVRRFPPLRSRGLTQRPSKAQRHGSNVVAGRVEPGEAGVSMRGKAGVTAPGYNRRCGRGWGRGNSGGGPAAAWIRQREFARREWVEWAGSGGGFVQGLEGRPAPSSEPWTVPPSGLWRATASMFPSLSIEARILFIL